MFSYWFRKLADKLEEKAEYADIEAAKWGHYCHERSDVVARAATLRTLAEALREVVGE